MQLKTLPLVTALIPIVALHLCYLLAAHLGHISWCFPYFPDCVSISATVRHSPERALFRAALIPTAVLMVIYWRLNAVWLDELGAQRTLAGRAMPWLGAVGVLGLFLYSSLLGEAGDPYRVARRVGMIMLYLGTYLAQLALTVQLGPAVRAGVSAAAYGSIRAICGAVAVLAALALLSWAFYDDYRRYEDAFEWGLTLLLLGHTLAVYFAWRDSGFQARFSIREEGS